MFLAYASSQNSSSSCIICIIFTSRNDLWPLYPILYYFQNNRNNCKQEQEIDGFFFFKENFPNFDSFSLNMALETNK